MVEQFHLLKGSCPSARPNPAAGSEGAQPQAAIEEEGSPVAEVGQQVPGRESCEEEEEARKKASRHIWELCLRRGRLSQILLDIATAVDWIAPK